MRADFTAASPSPLNCQRSSHVLPCTRHTSVANPAEPFRFSFPDLAGRTVSNTDARFAGKVVLVNISGSLVLGFFLVFTTERMLVDVRWRWLIAIGFCGSYTTFSSYAFETFGLFEQGQWLLVGLNVITSNVLCLVSVLAGAALARWL